METEKERENAGIEENEACPTREQQHVATRFLFPLHGSIVPPMPKPPAPQGKREKYRFRPSRDSRDIKRRLATRRGRGKQARARSSRSREKIRVPLPLSVSPGSAYNVVRTATTRRGLHIARASASFVIPPRWRQACEGNCSPGRTRSADGFDHRRGNGAGVDSRSGDDDDDDGFSWWRKVHARAAINASAYPRVQ